jgi:hypothetical protein
MNHAHEAIMYAAMAVVIAFLVLGAYIVYQATPHPVSDSVASRVSVATTTPFTTGKEFMLTPSESAVGLGLKVTLRSVVAHATCPTGITCLWSGKSVAETSIDAADGHYVDIQMIQGQSYTFGNSTIIANAIVPDQDGGYARYMITN